MGFLMWGIAGGAAAAAARLVAFRRPPWFFEVVAGVLSGCIFGIAATVLDFGGWREPDWRAGLFALFGALAVIGLLRLVRMIR